MVYFAQDMTTNEYIMPYKVTVETRSQLTSEINTKISTLTITGSLVSFPCPCCVSCFKIFDSLITRIFQEEKPFYSFLQTRDNVMQRLMSHYLHRRFIVWNSPPFSVLTATYQCTWRRCCSLVFRAAMINTIKVK